jgi:hypothetical protein
MQVLVVPLYQYKTEGILKTEEKKSYNELSVLSLIKS